MEDGLTLDEIWGKMQGEKAQKKEKEMDEWRLAESIRQKHRNYLRENFRFTSTNSNTSNAGGSSDCLDFLLLTDSSKICLTNESNLVNQTVDTTTKDNLLLPNCSKVITTDGTALLK